MALRIAGVNAGTLAVGGAFAAVLLGLAAQQSLGAIFAGIVLQTTRPFRVGERVRFVGGALAGSMEGTVTSLGLFYTTLSQGADRLQIPNNVLLNLAVVPLREPEKVDVQVRFPRHVSPRDVEQQLLRTITVPTRYRPSVSLEEIEPDCVIMKSPRPRCAPRTAPSWPRRSWRPCTAATPPNTRPRRKRRRCRTEAAVPRGFGTGRSWRPAKGRWPSRPRPWQAVAVAETAGSAGVTEKCTKSAGSPRFGACWTTVTSALHACRTTHGGLNLISAFSALNSGPRTTEDVTVM